jgi:putative membrane protein
MLLPLLHFVPESRPFLLSWAVDPPVFIGLLLAGFGYWIAWRRVQLLGRRKLPTSYAVWYFSGLLTIAVALLGPFDVYNEDSLLLHMAQHLLLLQLAAPMIWLGRPVQLTLQAISPRRSGPVLKSVLRRSWVRSSLSFIGHPLVVFLIFNVTVIFWHVPAVYDAALRHQTIHDLEHLAFLGAALIYWWPIIEPVPRHHKLRMGFAVASIFLTGLVAEALGAILSLDSSLIYPFYSTARPLWGLSPLSDQEYAGLLMWVGGGMLYLTIIFAILIRNLGGDDYQASVPATASPQ